MPDSDYLFFYSIGFHFTMGCIAALATAAAFYCVVLHIVNYILSLRNKDKDDEPNEPHNPSK